MSCLDWYTIENLIAAGVAPPMDLVCSENKWGRDRANDPAPVDHDHWRVDHMDQFSATGDRIAADRIDGAA